MKKRTEWLCILCLAACAVCGAWRAAAQGGERPTDDDNAQLDELGQVPLMRLRFDGTLDSAGERACAFDNRQMAKLRQKGPSYVAARSGEQRALRLGANGFFPYITNMSFGDEWTIVAIAKGVDAEGAIIWSSGTARGKGSRALALAATGKGGVKLVQWWGGAADGKLLAMKDVVHFGQQFHVYAVTKGADGAVALWVDGKKAGESREFAADGFAGEFTFGSFHWAGKGGGCAAVEGVELDDWRVYDTALGEVQLLQIANGNAPWPEGLPMPKEKISAFIDTNSVLRLGYEIPERIVIGTDGEKRLYAKGVLAQGGIGGEKRFELGAGGQFALGSGGFVFDSNYARARTNEVVFSGGALLSFEPTFVKSGAPIQLRGTSRLIANRQLVVRASFEGDGNLVKTGEGTLGLQYPCDRATGKLTVANGSTVVLGPAATWGGTIELAKGATLKCVSANVVGRIVKAAGAKVIESNPGATDVGADAFPQPATGYKLKHMQKERMGRGVYAVRQTEKDVMVGWRYKSSDPTNIAFNVYANGTKLNASPIADVTYFKTPWTGRATTYEVRAVVGGREATFKVSGSWTLPANAPVGSFDIALTPPPKTKMPDGTAVAHHPCDCSIGDLDGDGEYELVVIWWPDNGADNSSWHKTGDTWLEGVKLDGTNRSLWKINLGPNIRSGSHYVPVMVCDMDGDGTAEVVCRTAEGTVDGKGRVQGADGVFAPATAAAFTDWRATVPGAHILWARNFTTAFDGATGAAVDAVPFKPDVLSDAKRREEATARAKAGTDKDGIAGDEKAINREWSSRNPGNQAFRMLGAVAYLDGVHPSVVLCRGYYSRTCLTAYDLVDKKLKERWFFCSDEPRWWGYGGQGFHNLRVGDVDFDGKDEIVYGHMVVDHDGQGLYTTGMGHGDAIHLIQGAPTLRGLQVWTCHEAPPFGVTLFDAQSGRIRFWTHGPIDTGSCNALDIDPDQPGMELFGGAHTGIYSALTGQRYMGPKPNPKDNYYGTLRFGIWWRGDLTRSAYSGGSVIKGYSVKGRALVDKEDLDARPEGAEPNVHSNHGTKGCPCLVADLFGDWREEILLTRRDNRAIRVYLSPHDTPYRFHTFLEDPVYRISVLTQNNGYNVPTDPGFYFGPDLKGHKIWFRGTYLE
ncbi:MAG: hypothetical protein II924_04385 [Kiritimatiellae bacterium]|nr:hypothetical protein [Kiritimatiellia bacterium]